MAFKVNYGLERAERNRAKQAKKEAKALARKNPGAADAGGDEVAESPADAAPERPAEEN